MRFKRKKVHTEFELDLAPLLAVMVKLVPVLLLTTSFVQFSAMDTQLPSSKSIADKKEEKPAVTMALKSTGSTFELRIEQEGQILKEQKDISLPELRGTVKALSQEYSDIKTFFISPSNESSFEEMTSLLELSPVKEVVLANVFEGGQ